MSVSELKEHAITTVEPTSNVPTETVIVKEAPKKTRTKVRTLDEILECSPNKLTDTERLKYIEYLQEQLQKATNQRDAYKNSAEQAIRKTQALADEINCLNAKFFDIQQTMSVAYKSILLLTKENR